MLSKQEYNGGENFDLRDILLKGRRIPLEDRVNLFGDFLYNLSSNKQMLHLRCISSPSDREVEVFDEYLGITRRMLMFGSNNYLGFANNPYIKDYVKKIIDKYGIGIGGPPLLNGYTKIHKELEERLASLKGAEDALIFSSGYGANVGLVSALVGPDDYVVYDQYSHASFYDGMKMCNARGIHFLHNNVENLKARLEDARKLNPKNIYVGVEGVYSMDGDVAPLDEIVTVCKDYDAILLVDDAHGTGTIGKYGGGSGEYFGLDSEIDITMGTFSKSFAVTGGFVTAAKPIIDYLRYFARSYMFSASISPVTIASVLAGLDLLENDPTILNSLHSNIRYAAGLLNKIGFNTASGTPIIPLRVPTEMNIRDAGYKFHQRGIFINSIEYPAVPVSQQRFRISITANHTKEDINKLVEVVEEIWGEYELKRTEPSILKAM
ncbi:MAG TPA: pyridoxal phosphate-dependent aminotransferase family protein [Ignavibacteriaceae bacterium]